MHANDKVVQLHKRHKTFRALAEHARNEHEAVRGAVVYFTKDGRMRFAHVGLECADIGMMTMYINKLGVEMMND